MLDSIGTIIDALCIENIKIALMKEKLNSSGAVEGDEEYVIMYQKMMDLNSNRSLIARALDDKINRVLSGEKNSVLKAVKTYG